MVVGTQCGHGCCQHGEQKERGKPGRHDLLDVDRNDLIDVPLGHSDGDLPEFLEEDSVGQRANRKGNSCHGKDEDTADENRTVQGGVIFDGHKPHCQLRLGQDSNTYHTQWWNRQSTRWVILPLVMLSNPCVPMP